MDSRTERVGTDDIKKEQDDDIKNDAIIIKKEEDDAIIKKEEDDITIKKEENEGFATMMDLQTYTETWGNLMKQREELRRRKEKVKKREKELKKNLQMSDVTISVVDDHFRFSLEHHLKKSKIAVDRDEFEDIQIKAVNKFIENTSSEIEASIKSILDSNSSKIKRIVDKVSEDFFMKVEDSFERRLTYLVQQFLYPHVDNGSITKMESSQIRKTIVRKFMESKEVEEMDVDDEAVVGSFLSTKSDEIRIATENEIQNFQKSMQGDRGI